MVHNSPHHEQHKSHRNGWLRAGVLGANDGIVSTASLIIGVAAANAAQADILLAGVAGLVAGAMSMAAGEYVSVSSQADTERADLAIEQRAIKEDHAAELEELAMIYQQRGLTPDLSKQVAEQLMAHDALAAHARDEIGISPTSSAKPLLAAASSAAMFFAGAILPLITAWLAPLPQLIMAVALLSLLSLALLGSAAAYIGGAPIWRGALRVLFWGAAAMALTAAVGSLFEVSTV